MSVKRLLPLSRKDSASGNGTKGWSVGQQEVIHLKVSEDNSSTTAFFRNINII